MTSVHNDEMRDKLLAVLGDDISPDAMKGVKKATDSILDTIESDLMWRLKDEMAANLTAWVHDLAGRAIDAMLNGNENEMRRYLSCEKRADGSWLGYTGRSTGYTGNRDIAGQHPIIHGKLHENLAVDIRRKLFEAHRDMIVAERVLDLEDQVKSLVEQVNKANAEKSAMWERCRPLL